ELSTSHHRTLEGLARAAPLARDSQPEGTDDVHLDPWPLHPSVLACQGRGPCKHPVGRQGRGSRHPCCEDRPLRHACEKEWPGALEPRRESSKPERVLQCHQGEHHEEALHDGPVKIQLVQVLGAGGALARSRRKLLEEGTEGS